MIIRMFLEDSGCGYGNGNCDDYSNYSDDYYPARNQGGGHYSGVYGNGYGNGCYGDDNGNGEGYGKEER